MTDKTRLYTGAAIGLVAAAALGFGAARLTQSPAPAPAPTEAAAPAKPSNTVAMTQQALSASQITVAPAASGELDAAILASATVEATPDAEAVLTARAPGTVSRIMVRIGDLVRAGQTLALVESRDASQIAADRSAASARVTLAARQLERERGLLARRHPRADYEAAQANLAVARPMPGALAPPQALPAYQVTADRLRSSAPSRGASPMLVPISASSSRLKPSCSASPTRAGFRSRLAFPRRCRPGPRR